jgi:hypothetical protein
MQHPDKSWNVEFRKRVHGAALTAATGESLPVSMVDDLAASAVA